MVGCDEGSDKEAMWERKAVARLVPTAEIGF